MAAGVIYCRGCREPLGDGARFCPSCGQPSPEFLRQRAADTKARHEQDRSGVLAVANVFVLALGGLLAVASWFEPGQMGAVAAHAVSMGVAAGVGAACLGWKPVARWLPLGVEPRGLLWGVGAGLLGFAASWAYVMLLRAVVSGGGAGEGAEEFLGDDGLPVALMVSALVVAPMLEELLCRGVMWEGARRLGGDTAALMVSSILFAFLHALNGGFLAEVPHRFVVGLLLGWVRMRTGSLWPGVVGHFTLNGLALAFAGG